MKQGSEATDEAADVQQELWLGYDGLVVPLGMISALLVYQPVWDRRIMHDYGSVPPDVQVVVLLHDGRALPARRALADLRMRWNAWQAAQTDEAFDQESAADAAVEED